MPFRKCKAMKTQEELQDPQNAFLTLPRKYSKTPALCSCCSAFSNDPGDEVFWSIRVMDLLSILVYTCYGSSQYSVTFCGNAYNRPQLFLCRCYPIYYLILILYSGLYSLNF